MSVFKASGITGITPLVILTMIVTMFGGAAAWAAWVYPIEAPHAPNTTHLRHLNNPTVAQIQHAIAPHTRIDIAGDVDASNGDMLLVEVDDVLLNFAHASSVEWSGPDTWDGFVGISGTRVAVKGLQMHVADSSGGKCRGVVVYTPASDVLISNCEFSDTSDGVCADGEWQRLAIEHSKFLNCGDWQSDSMDGGYGMFLEDDDDQPDNLRLTDVTITLNNASDQHGLRISKVQNILIDGCEIGANGKRSLWAYGVEKLAIKNTTFNNGSVQFNLKPYELQTDQPTRHVRMAGCVINHTGILNPVTIMCGKGTADWRMKNCQINSTSANTAIDVAWREDSQDITHGISWEKASVKFNGHALRSKKDYSISPDWNAAERKDLKIGPTSSGS